MGLDQSIMNLNVCVCVCVCVCGHTYIRTYIHKQTGGEGREDRLVNMEGVPEWKKCFTTIIVKMKSKTTIIIEKIKSGQNQQYLLNLGEVW